MKGVFIYLLTSTRESGPQYDVAGGFVIQASTEAVARALASQYCGDEGPDAWLDPKQASCEMIGRARVNIDKVVLRSFHAG